MSPYTQADETANAKVLGLAGVASAVAGSVIAALMHRRAVQHQELESRSRRLSSRLDSTVESATDSLSRAIAEAPQSRKEWASAMERLRAQAAESASDGRKLARERLDDLDLQRTSGRARNAVPSAELPDQLEKLGKRARSAVKDQRRQSMKRLESVDIEKKTRQGKRAASGLAAEVASGASTLAASAGDQSQELVETLKQQTQQARERADDVLSDAKTLGEHLVEQAKDRTPELLDAVERSIVPRAKELRENAAPLISSATAALASSIEAGKELAVETKHSADRQLVPALKERAEAAAESIDDVSSQASETWSDLSGTVDQRSREAAQAAAQGTKNTGALAAWSMVAGGLVYYGFLDDEQREKLKAAGSRIAREAREIYRDIQTENKA